MAKLPKKTKDTIVISKRSLYLIFFLVLIAIAVAIAVPMTIHIKEKRRKENEGHQTEVPTEVGQIGKDGVFYGHLVSGDIYYMDDDDDDDDNNDVEYVTDCISEATSISSDNDTKYVTDCVDPDPSIYRYISGEEEEYNGIIIKNTTDFANTFGFEDSKYNSEFFYKNMLVSVVVHMDYCDGIIERVYISGSKGTVGQLTVEYIGGCDECDDEMDVYLISVPKSAKIDAVSKANYVNLEISPVCEPFEVYDKKPVIYLYPTSTTDVDVKLGAPERLTVSYPKYTDLWRVTANPDGTLVDRTTGRNLYSLYYEAEFSSKGMHDEGFVVKGTDSASFFEEKLAQLGLTEREAEEFIIYWLPVLEKNAYNYIYFNVGAKVDEIMPLSVSPAPDTTIRINVEMKALDAPIEIKTQQLPEMPVRQGFTLVEWGGTIL